MLRICIHEFRLRAAGGKGHGDGGKKTRRDRPARAAPVPEANAELQANLDVWHMLLPPTVSFPLFHFYFQLIIVVNKLEDYHALIFCGDDRFKFCETKKNKKNKNHGTS